MEINFCAQEQVRAGSGRPCGQLVAGAVTALAGPPQKAVPLLDTIAARSRPGSPDTIMARGLQHHREGQ